MVKLLVDFFLSFICFLQKLFHFLFSVEVKRTGHAHTAVYICIILNGIQRVLDYHTSGIFPSYTRSNSLHVFLEVVVCSRDNYEWGVFKQLHRFSSYSLSNCQMEWLKVIVGCCIWGSENEAVNNAVSVPEKLVQFSTWEAKSLHSGEESTFKVIKVFRFFFWIVSESFVNFTNDSFSLYLHYLWKPVEQSV